MTHYRLNAGSRNVPLPAGADQKTHARAACPPAGRIPPRRTAAEAAPKGRPPAISMLLRAIVTQNLSPFTVST